VELLHLGKGAVLARGFDRPLAVGVDESEQSAQARNGRPCSLLLPPARAAPPCAGHARQGRHAVVRVEAEVAAAFREGASVSGSTTIEFLASFWRVGARDLAS